MDKEATIITACDVYATRGGRLVFIKKIERDETDPNVRAYGYSVAGSRRDSTDKWRVWALSGEVISEDGPEWDIIQAL